MGDMNANGMSFSFSLFSKKMPSHAQVEAFVSDLCVTLLICGYLMFHYHDILLRVFAILWGFCVSLCNPLAWDNLMEQVVQRLREF